MHSYLVFWVAVRTVLGPYLGPLGSIFSCLVADVVPLGEILGCLGGSWEPLGRSSGGLGAILR